MGRRDIAGVILAGGRSSRMRQNKALLDYNGQTLLDHMIALLQQSGLKDIYVSGNLKGYWCLPDRTPHEGPACAIHDVLQYLDDYEGALFVPVDMPLLTPEILEPLLMKPKGAFYEGCFLPAYITSLCSGAKASSVRELLGKIGVEQIALPEEFKPFMNNSNTPEEWQEALRA